MLVADISGLTMTWLLLNACGDDSVGVLHPMKTALQFSHRLAYSIPEGLEIFHQVRLWNPTVGVLKVSSTRAREGYTRSSGRRNEITLCCEANLPGLSLQPSRSDARSPTLCIVPPVWRVDQYLTSQVASLRRPLYETGGTKSFATSGWLKVISVCVVLGVDNKWNSWPIHNYQVTISEGGVFDSFTTTDQHINSPASKTI